MFISIVFLIVALIMIGTSALGIFLSRKSKALKNYTSKVPTIIFVSLLSIITFFIEAIRTNYAYAIGHIIGYIYFWSLLSSSLAVLFLNKFKFNKKEFWTSWFFSLIWIFLILITQEILKI